jgi:hypothetical protein
MYLFKKFVVLCVAAPVEDPEFTEQIENITVPAGRNVKLACSVKNLGNYKVMSRQAQHTQIYVNFVQHSATEYPNVLQLNFSFLYLELNIILFGPHIVISY